ncbi:M23/M56 family metallopeptidase [Pseudomarimonas arenosa]|uniref:Peptidoglycan DD-metalloendopeptidase family protein n=1 Tax=Pseudomarimonas arenosa TaxID=2774145 RepID=A0AAW3ZN84_9GAMM|nr:M23/M56 family metallopeptidase [Pseudomarimonas arenosa]MBD8527595.1 peptidoglycan DD-metalloendopeptidase family protein [Pseudomarimonas arenosa]
MSAGPLALQLGTWLLASLLLWLAAVALHRRWRWPADRPGYWWAVLALLLAPSFVATLLPADWRPTPQLLVVGDPGTHLADDSLSAVTRSRVDAWTHSSIASSATSAGVWLYFLLLATLIARRWQQRNRLRELLAKCTALPMAALPGQRSQRLAQALKRRGIALRCTAETCSPFSLPRDAGLIVLPSKLLARLNDRQCWLLLRHEAAHLRCHDGLKFALLGWLCTVAWFNPVLWWLSHRIRLASELRCDRLALGARKNMRRAYAEAYLETLRMSAARALPCPAAAFSPHDLGHHKMRISHILSSPGSARKSRRVVALTLALTGAVMLTAVHASSRAEPAASADSSSPTTSLQGPIIEGKISSVFGVQRPKLSKTPHRGVDLVAPRGTPVRAAAAGTVRTAELPYQQAPRYGNVVIIEHADGWQTLYAHLDRIEVSAGERIAAGQSIGSLGASGQATGPHVHVEVFHHGQRVDPQSAIAQLVAPH